MTLAAACCLLAARQAQASVYTNTYIYKDYDCDCVYGYAEMYADYAYNDGNYYYPSLSATLYGPAGYVGGYDSGEGDTYLSVNYLNLYDISAYGDGDYELDADSYMYYDGPYFPEPYNLSYWMQFFIYAPEFFDFYNGPEATGQPVGDLGEVYSKTHYSPPHPINFVQTNAYDAGSGTLHFEYYWDSSTGRLADLARCTVSEKVTYDPADIPFPSPPFPTNLSPDNPTFLSVPGDFGRGQDNHRTPGTFVKPYVARTVTATQIYYYTCRAAYSGALTGPITLAGPHSIVRSVSQNGDGSWKFQITKNGFSASINPLP
jgi:hypothetical protein